MSDRVKTSRIPRHWRLAIALTPVAVLFLLAFVNALIVFPEARIVALVIFGLLVVIYALNVVAQWVFHGRWYFDLRDWT